MCECDITRLKEVHNCIINRLLSVMSIWNLFLRYTRQQVLQLLSYPKQVYEREIINPYSSDEIPLPQAYNHVVKNYSDELMEYAEAIRAQLSETAIAEAEAARDSFVDQFECVKDVRLFLVIHLFLKLCIWLFSAMTQR